MRIAFVNRRSPVTISLRAALHCIRITFPFSMYIPSIPKSRSIARAKAGHVCDHVNFLGLGGYKDWQLMAKIHAEDYTLVTNNRADFICALRARRAAPWPCDYPAERCSIASAAAFPRGAGTYRRARFDKHRFGSSTDWRCHDLPGIPISCGDQGLSALLFCDGVPQSILIDTDTASDDAVALIMALRSENAQVIAITTVAGNVPVQQATRNALYTAELCGASTPLYQGAEKPLARPLSTAEWFHGADGLGDHGYPPPRCSAQKQHAVEAIIATVRSNPGMTIVTLGPLTNIALALAQAPDLVPSVGRCVVMGGAPCCEGNVTPAAEYNMWVDPEAARMVFRSGLPIELVGWQLCRGGAVISPADIEFIGKIGTPLAHFAVECNSTARAAYRKQTGEDGISLPDPVCMSIALDPSIGYESSRHYVDIETESELTRGMTVVDRLGVAADQRNRTTWAELIGREPNAKVYWAIDAPRWKQALYAALK